MSRATYFQYMCESYKVREFSVLDTYVLNSDISYTWIDYMLNTRAWNESDVSAKIYVSRASENRKITICATSDKRWNNSERLVSGRSNRACSSPCSSSLWKLNNTRGSPVTYSHHSSSRKAPILQSTPVILRVRFRKIVLTVKKKKKREPRMSNRQADCCDAWTW